MIRNQSLAPALNECLRSCGTTFFFKVDDDFFLHPKAIEFMRQQALLLPDTGWSIYCCALWDSLRSRLIGNIKLYNVEALNSIGGFSADKRGRVDGGIISRSKAANVRIIHDHKSVVGLHVCGSPEDQILHRELWKGNIKIPPEVAGVFYQTISMKTLFRKRIQKLDYLNTAYKSQFFHWIQKQKEGKKQLCNTKKKG